MRSNVVTATSKSSPLLMSTNNVPIEVFLILATLPANLIELTQQ